MASERAIIAGHFRTIDSGDLIALPPSPERFDQDEGHAEARRIAAERGVVDPSWVFWHRQSASAFDADGNLASGLRLHWGGDHNRVLVALAAVPAPLRVVDHGPGGAFEVVSDGAAARRDADFPAVADTKAVKARIETIVGPPERRTPESWTPAENAWLERVLLEGDLAAQAAVVGWVAESPYLTDGAVDHLVAHWTKIYPKAPGWVLVSGLLRLLDRRGDPRLEALLDVAEKRRGYVFRAGAGQFLTERVMADPHGPTAEMDLARLARFAFDPGRYVHTPGNVLALHGLVEARAKREGRTAAEVVTELLGDPRFDEAARHSLQEIIERGW